jgi:hypothetical protein
MGVRGGVESAALDAVGNKQTRVERMIHEELPTVGLLA